MTSTLASAQSIRHLNDAFRWNGFASGQWMLTNGVADLGPEFMVLAIRAVRNFADFSEGNDPYGEHDFGSFNLAGETLFWKIDYYDLTLTCGSERPGDAAVTRRVLTIMLASEY